VNEAAETAVRYGSRSSNYGCHQLLPRTGDNQMEKEGNYILIEASVGRKWENDDKLIRFEGYCTVRREEEEERKRASSGAF